MSSLLCYRKFGEDLTVPDRQSTASVSLSCGRASVNQEQHYLKDQRYRVTNETGQLKILFVLKNLLSDLVRQHRVVFVQNLQSPLILVFGRWHADEVFDAECGRSGPMTLKEQPSRIPESAATTG
jgi:hypothetical protein